RRAVGSIATLGPPAAVVALIVGGSWGYAQAIAVGPPGRPVASSPTASSSITASPIVTPTRPSTTPTLSPSRTASASAQLLVSKRGSGSGSVISKTPRDFTCSARCTEASQSYGRGEKVEIVAGPRLALDFLGGSVRV